MLLHFLFFGDRICSILINTKVIRCFSFAVLCLVNLTSFLVLSKSVIFCQKVALFLSLPIRPTTI